MADNSKRLEEHRQEFKKQAQEDPNINPSLRKAVLDQSWAQAPTEATIANGDAEKATAGITEKTTRDNGDLDEEQEAKQQAQESRPVVSDLESILTTKMQRKKQETQETWGELAKTIYNDEDKNPYFVTLGPNEQKILIFIKPTNNPTDLDSEMYIAITKDGPLIIPATEEIRGMISKKLLNSGSDSDEYPEIVSKIKTLNMIPSSPEDEESFDLISSVIKKSKELAIKIREIIGETKNLEGSKALAEKLRGVVGPQQASSST